MQMESGRIKGRFILEADLGGSKIMVGLLISALLRSGGSFIEHFTLANRPRHDMIGNRDHSTISPGVRQIISVGMPSPLSAL